MRIRHKHYARGELAAWARHNNNPAASKGCWNEFFKDPTLPLMLELGCGKGSFLATHALAEPQHNHLGIDMKSEMLVVAKRNIENDFQAAGQALGNIAIAPFNIEKVEDILSEKDQVHRLYINFCNPWYKSGHSKHRLTHPRQLVQYRRILHPQAELYFKTDDTRLYLDSLRYFKMCGFEMTWESRDLHKDEPAWNIRTEHEQMFSDRGVPIKACILKIVPAQLDEAAISRLKDI